MIEYIRLFNEINLGDLEIVGGKNASLGEMYQKLTSKGINIPSGFATTSNAYWRLLEDNKIKTEITVELEKLDTKDFKNLQDVSQSVKDIILQSKIPADIREQIITAYRNLGKETESLPSVAVRSSATAEDLPNASFAGQQESFLNIKGEDELIETCLKCYASLFTQRAIKYRIDQGFDHMNVALSIGIQHMVRSDLSCSGVIFTIDPETGFENSVVINGIWGLGDNIVQGRVDPDEFVVFKPSLRNGKKCILSKSLGKKQETLIYSTDKNSATQETIVNQPTPISKANQYVITDKEIELLAKWAVEIEQHYQSPMDIEWAKDGITNKIYIVQARPETVHSSKGKDAVFYSYQLEEKGIVLCQGLSLGNKIAHGKARLITSPKEGHKLKEGEILVTENTSPDWDPIMKKAAAIVTNKGGRTSHAAIVARELGAVAVVGTGDATNTIKDGQEITVSCAEGKTGFIYDGVLKWSKHSIDLSGFEFSKTDIMFILSDPDSAFNVARLPNSGVGLLRMEFIINSTIQIHPMALINFDQLKDEKTKDAIEKKTRDYKSKSSYFVDKLSQGIATVAAAFYPKDVIVRMSDFKTNEYKNLIGGNEFEPKEENPMLGFRGASRYFHPLYKEGFKLECEAIKVVRNEMGLENVKVMIPFCRTIKEGENVIDLMASSGLVQGENGLEIYMMVELPSNVILMDQFVKIFDGFSIGSNDLTQLTLGIDRDSELLKESFNETNEAVKRSIAKAISIAKQNNKRIGICGQAPSDIPEFAAFLVEAGIDSVSFNSDAILKGMASIHKAEKGVK